MGLGQRLATAILELTTDTTGFVRGLDDAQRKAGGFSQAIDAVGAQMQAVGRSMATAGAAMTAGITVPLVAVGGGALKAATDFESSFAGIRKTVGDATDQFGNLTSTGRLLETGMRDLARQIPLNVNELNRIGEAAGQLGIKSENILGFTRTMAALGVTTNLSSDEAATALARLANITQMPQEHFDRLGSTIVALGNNLATTESEITEFGLRIAGAGKQVGLSEAQILAIGGALSSVGIHAEAGGTAISKVMIDMASSVDAGGDRLQQFADVARMSAADFATQFRTDAAGALTAFVAGLGNLEGTGRTTLGVLADMEITETRMRDALLRASGAGDLLTNSLRIGTDAWRENTALTREAEQRYQTTASQMTLLWNNVRDVAIQLGQALLPIVHRVIEALQGFLPYVQKVVDWFTQLSPTTQTVIVAIGGLVAALGPALVVIGTLAMSVGAALPVLTAVGGAIVAFVTGPIGLMVAAVAGLAFVWIRWGDDITRVVSETWAAVKTWLWDRLGPVIEPIGGLLQSVGGMFAALRDLVVAVMGVALAHIATFVTGAVGWLRDRLSPVIDPVLALLRSIATVTGWVATEAIACARQLYEGVKNWLLDRFTSIIDGIKGKVDAVAGFFRDLKDKVVGHSYIPDMVTMIGAEMARLPAVLVTPAQVATTAVATAVSGMADRIVTSFDLLGLTWRDYTQRFMLGGISVQDIAASLERAQARLAEQHTITRRTIADLITQQPLFVSSIQAITDAVKETSATMEAARGPMRGFFDGILRGARGLVGGLTGGQGLSGFFENIGFGITQSLGNILTGGMQSLVNAGIGIAMRGLQQIGGFFRDLFSGPSAKELAGREVVANFEANVQSMLNERQKLEAGNESWKQTVVVVRDAYLALGRTEAEALAAVEALWRSSKGGAEDVERAMRPIQTALDEVARRAQETGKSIDELRADGMASGQRLTETFARTAGVVEAIGEIGAEVARRLQETIGDLEFEIPIHFRSDGGGPGGPIPMAAGGAGIVTRPTLFLAGERGPEEFAFSGAHRRFSGDGSGALAEKFDRLERALLFALPSMVERAARHGAQTAGRRR